MNQQANQTIDLKTMSIVELESLCWRHSVQIENSRQAIQIINQEIALKSQQVSQNGSNKPELVKSGD